MESLNRKLQLSKMPFIKGDRPDLAENVGGSQLLALRRNLHRMLWSGGRALGNEIFSFWTNIILTKIYDEEQTKKGEKYQFQVLTAGENGERSETAGSVYRRLNKLYRRALVEKLNFSKNEAARAKIVDKRKFGLNKLTFVVSRLEGISLVKSLGIGNILGDFFEEIIDSEFRQSKGQFFTPANIVLFIVYALEMDVLAVSRMKKQGKLPFVIDPSCGVGNFLTGAMKVIGRVVGKMELGQQNQYRQQKNLEYLYGMEINFDLGLVCKINLIMRGMTSANIYIGQKCGNGLLPFCFYKKTMETTQFDRSFKDPLYQGKSVNAKFGVVLSNPPFSLSLDEKEREFLRRGFKFGNKKSSQNLFIERWYQLLKPGGRLGVVLPESVFETAANKYIRLFLFKYFWIKAIISLPQLTFEPYTSCKTSILLAKKKTSAEVRQWNEVWNKKVYEFRELKAQVGKYNKDYLRNKHQTKFSFMKDYYQKETKGKVLRFLKDFLEEKDRRLNTAELLGKYQTEIKRLEEESDYNDEGVCLWWVFVEAAKKLNYKIFMAEAKNVGYKRTRKRGYLKPNDLFALVDGEVDLSKGKDKILNILRSEVKW